MSKAIKGDAIEIYIPDLNINVFGYYYYIGNMKVKSAYVVPNRHTALRHMKDVVRIHNRNVER